MHIDKYERDNLNTLANECISDASEHEGEDCLHAESLRPHAHIRLLLQVQHVRERALSSSVTYPV
jgi:hypothetical protein